MAFLRLGASGPLLKTSGGGFVVNSNVPAATTAPGAVSTLQATNITQSGMTLVWGGPTGTPPFTYTVKMKAHSATDYATVTTTSAQQYTLSGLNPSTQYDIYILATNPYGTSGTGNIVSPTTAGVSLVPPGPVVPIVGTITTTSVTLNWTAPAGSTPLTYTPQYKLHSASSYTNLTPTTSTFVTVTSLTPATQYDFQVSVSNSAGSNSSGTIVTATTSTVTAVAPGPITLSTPAMSDVTATLFWSAATGGGSMTYQPQFKLHTAPSYANFGSPVTGTTAIVTGLTASSSYDFQVIASNSVLPVSTSNAVTASTTAAPGSSPANLSAITYTQNYPIHPTTSSTFIGYADPVGGVGPYTWEYVSETNNGVTTVMDQTHFGSYKLFPRSQYNGVSFDGRPAIYADRYGDVNGVTTSTDSFTLRCTDARGTVVTGTFSVAKTSAGVDAIGSGDRLVTNNAGNRPEDGPFFAPWVRGPSFPSGFTYGTPLDQNTGQPSTVVVNSYGNIVPATNPMQAGTFNLRIPMISVADNTHIVNYDATFQIINYTDTRWRYMEYIPKDALTTSTAPGIIVGKVACTTPMNLPVFSLADPNGWLRINQSTGEVVILTTPSTAGNMTFSVTVSDYAYSFTHSFTVNVVAGVTLPSSNLTFSQNAVNNYSLSQTLGTPHVTGLTGSPTWTLLGYTDRSPSGAFGELEPLRMLDRSTGVITQWDGIGPAMPAVISPYLAAKTYQLQLTVTDGVRTCTNTVNVVVDPPAVTTTYHIGEGMATLYPGYGFEHLVELFRQPQLLQQTHTDKRVFKIHANANPEYYTGDWDGTTLNGYSSGVTGGYMEFVGPFRLEGVSLPDGTQARIGGPSDGMHQVEAHPRYGGLVFRLGGADCEIVNLEFSGFHSAPATYTGSNGPLFKNHAYGDVLIQNCVFRDNDLAYATSPGHQTTTITGCEFTQTASSLLFSAGGAAHEIYVEGSNLNIDNCVFRSNHYGHLIKDRCQTSSITNCRIYEGLIGTGAHQVNYPNAGRHYLANNVIVKGTQPWNSDMIRYGEDTWSYSDNYLLAENNVFVVFSPPGGQNYGPPTVFGMFERTSDITGQRGTAVIRNNQYYLPNPTSSQDVIATDASGSCLVSVYDALNNFTRVQSGSYVPVLTNNVKISVPPAFDFMTRPYLAGQLPLVHNAWRKTQGYDSTNPYPNFSDAIHIPDRHEIRVPHTAATGTVLCNFIATSTADTQNDHANYFDTTTTWALDQTNTLYYGSTQNPTPWAPANRYTVTRNSDGSCTLKVGTGMPSSAGVDLIQLTATCSGHLSTMWYPIIVT